MMYGFRYNGFPGCTGTKSTLVVCGRMGVSLFLAVFVIMSLLSSRSVASASTLYKQSDPAATGYLLDEYPDVYAAYSLRKLRSDYDGPAIRVRRSSDNAEQDFGFVGDDLDVAGIESWLSGADGYVVAWYSQLVGEPDLVQTTASRQPRIAEVGTVFLDEKDLPRIKFDANRNTYLTLAAPRSSTIPIHDMLLQVVAERAGGQERAGILAFQKPGVLGQYTLIVNIQNGGTTIRSAISEQGQIWPAWGERAVWGLNNSGATAQSYVNIAPDFSRPIAETKTASHLTLGVQTQKADNGFDGFISEVVVHPGQADENGVFDRFDVMNGYWQAMPSDYNREALLPQRFAYQIALYDWLETITESDVTLPAGTISFNGSGLTPNELAKSYVLTEALSASRVLRQDASNLVLDDGAGGGIEGSGEVRLMHTPGGGGEAKAWENEVAYWYQLDAPGLTNPLHGHPNVARRALVMAAVDMMMYHEAVLDGGGLARNDQYGKAFASWAYVYYHCKEVLSASVQDAFEDGLTHFLDYMVQKGAWDVNTNMDMFSVYAAAYVYAAVDDAGIKDKAIQAAKKVLLGHPNATVGGPLHDPVEGTYYPAGYIGENNTPETFYNSESYTQLLGAYSVVPGNSEWAFLEDILRAMSTFRIAQQFPEPSGDYFGPAAYAGRTSAPMIGGQNDHIWRDVTAAYYFEEARPLLRKAGSGGSYLLERATSAWEISQNVDGVDLSVVSGITPPRWNGWESWIKSVPFLPPDGWYDTLNELHTSGDPSVLRPFDKAASYNKLHGGSPTGPEFWTYKSTDVAGREWGFFVEALDWVGPYGSWHGGSLQTFWTRDTGILVLAMHQKGGTPNWGAAETWAMHHVWGRDESGREFSSARVQGHVDYPIDGRVATHDANTNPPFVQVKSNLNDPTAFRRGEQADDVLTGTVEVANRFEALENGVRVIHTIDTDETDEATELWASIPIFLRNPHWSATQENIPEATIEFWDGSAWQTMPEDENGDGLPEMVSTSVLRIGRDFGAGPKYGYIHLDNEHSLRLSEEVWQRTYQIWDGGEKIRTLHIDLHGDPGTVKTLPASTSVSYTIQTTEPPLLGDTSSSQDIELRQGWNIVSSHVTPSDVQLESVLSDVLSDIEIVKDESGNIYSPSYGIDQVGTWDSKEAYMIYARAPVTLTLSGEPVEPQSSPIDLVSGWNLVSYLRNAPLPVAEAFTSVSSQLVMIKNEEGDVYYPDFGIDTIGSLLPGEGYKVYVTAPATLTYP